ncbi:MAG: glycoside hydrolase family 5 protein [Terriglobia bacterium]
MSTKALQKQRTTVAIGTTIVLLMFGVCGCSLAGAAPPSPSGAQPVSAGNDEGDHSVASSSILPADYGIPKNWPWRGVTLTDFGIPGKDVTTSLGPPSSGPKDIDDAAQAGANSVHLYLGIKKLAQRRHLNTAEAWTQAMQWLDLMLAECKKDHMVAIVGFQSFPMPNGGYYKLTSAEFWNNPAAVNQIYTQVSRLAKRLHTYGNEFVAYNIISEPTIRIGGRTESPPDWENIQKRIVETIRAQDPNRWIVVQPGPWGGAGGYKDFSPLPYSRLVYSVHIYAPHAYTYQGIKKFPTGVRYPGTIHGRQVNKEALEKYLTPVFRFQQQNHALIWVGEFSAVIWAPNSRQYLKDLVSTYDRYGWGWSYFAIGGWFGWDPNYNNKFAGDWKAAQAQRVGLESERWETLRELFDMNGE